jgi:hypothetical protein
MEYIATEKLALLRAAVNAGMKLSTVTVVVVAGAAVERGTVTGGRTVPVVSWAVEFGAFDVAFAISVVEFCMVALGASVVLLITGAKVTLGAALLGVVVALDSVAVAFGNVVVFASFVSTG